MISRAYHASLCFAFDYVDLNNSLHRSTIEDRVTFSLSRKGGNWPVREFLYAMYFKALKWDYPGYIEFEMKITSPTLFHDGDSMNLIYRHTYTIAKNHCGDVHHVRYAELPDIVFEGRDSSLGYKPLPNVIMGSGCDLIVNRLRMNSLVSLICDHLVKYLATTSYNQCPDDDGLNELIRDALDELDTDYPV